MEKALADKPAAHGLTHGQLAHIAELQQTGQDVPMIPANNGAKDQIGDLYFKEEYGDWEIPEHEKGFYHLAQEPRLFAQFGATPQRLSVSSVVKMHPPAYKHFMDNGMDKGKVIHILHNPTLEGKAKPKATAEEEDEDEGTDFDSYTVAELREYIEATTGEAPKSSANKAELIALAKKAESQASE
jgi:hypothetical protein